MPLASVMAESAQPLADAAEPGAPVAKDAIDPELIKLRRNRPKVGVITAAGLVFLCIYALLRLGPDRRFAGAEARPSQVTPADVLAGTVPLDTMIAIDVQPLMSQAIRSTTAKGSLGLRAVPTRAGRRLWLVISGDGWDAPAQGRYVGRLRKLADLPFAASITTFAAEHPRPVFAAAAAVRAGFASGRVATVTGDEVALSDADRVAFDVVDPNAAVIVAAFNERLPDTAAWTKALAAAGISALGPPTSTTEQVRYSVELPGAVATLTTKLEAAGLWAARVDSVTHHFETTWGALKASPPTGFSIAGRDVIPEPQLDLVGLYVTRAIPSDAYAVLTSERPEDYWYVMPISIALAAIGLVFAWALVRAVKRDLLHH